MNFIGKDTFVLYVYDTLVVRNRYRHAMTKWLKTWFKWYVKQPEASLQFLKVQYEESAVEFDFGGTSSEIDNGTYFYQHPQYAGGHRALLRNLNTYEKKDARAGLLYVYEPLVHWTVTNEFFALIQIKDYLCHLLEEDPKTDLNRYVRETVKAQSDAWHAEQVRLNQDNLKTKGLTNKWTDLKEGLDYAIVGTSECQTWTLVRLRSKRALVYEHERQHLCIDTYEHVLYNPGSLLLSLRNAKKVEDPVATIEAHWSSDSPLLTKAKSPLGPRQFMAACNRPYSVESPEVKAFHQIVIAACKHPDGKPQEFGHYRSEVFQPIKAPSGYLEYTINSDDEE